MADASAPPPSSAPLLVTGANGHLGRRLCERLHTRRPVRAVVRSERAAGVLRDLPHPPSEIEVLDYADTDALEAACRGCGAAVHLVGILKEGASSRYADAHEATCRSLAEAAARAGLQRIVYLSILGAGASSANACLASKGRAEAILLSGKVPATVLRVPMVLGPGDVASRALLGQARARWLPLVGGGRTWQQPIAAEDVLAAVLAALERPERGGEALDLAGAEALRHRDLVGRAAALVGGRPRILPIPAALARAGVWVLERVLSDPPVTTAMLEVLEHDDRVDPRDACERLGIALTPLDEVLRRCAGEPDAGEEASRG